MSWREAGKSRDARLSHHSTIIRRLAFWHPVCVFSLLSTDLGFAPTTSCWMYHLPASYFRADSIATMASTARKAPELEYWSSLLRYAENEREPPLGHFGKLQVMNIVHLLNDIARIKGDVENKRATTAEQMDLVGQRLHQYGKRDNTGYT